MPVQKPTLGRIVHYAEYGHVFPALVVAVNADGTINLVLWNETGMQFARKNVEFSQAPSKEKNTWFWPIVPKLTLQEVQKLGAQIRSELEKGLPPTTVKLK